MELLQLLLQAGRLLIHIHGQQVLLASMLAVFAPEKSVLQFPTPMVVLQLFV
jgi:hypothetical protein